MILNIRLLTQQIDILLQRAQKSLNLTFLFKSYHAIFLWTDLDCKLSACMHICSWLCKLKVNVRGPRKTPKIYCILYSDTTGDVWTEILRLSPFQFKKIEIFKLLSIPCLSSFLVQFLHYHFISIVLIRHYDQYWRKIMYLKLFTL